MYDAYDLIIRIWSVQRILSFAQSQQSLHSASTVSVPLLMNAKEGAGIDYQEN